jgi:hypothetical protein
MTELAKSEFKAPYPQAAMGGELGLTSQELAHGIGTTHSEMLRKMRRIRRFLSAQGVRMVESMSNATQGPNTLFVVDLTGAKYFAATWKNDLGFGYFKYLLTCERAAEEVVPKLRGRIQSLEALIAKLTAPKQSRIPGRGVVSVIVRTLHVVDMFGEIHDEIRREKKVYSELSPAEQRAYKIQHRSAVMKAIAALQDEDLNPKDRDIFH